MLSRKCFGEPQSLWWPMFVARWEAFIRAISSTRTFLCLQLQGVFFDWSHPRKVLNIADGKIPTKKVKVDLSNSKMWSFTLTFTFLVGILPSAIISTFWGGTSQKRHPVCRVYIHKCRVMSFWQGPVHQWVCEVRMRECWRTPSLGSACQGGEAKESWCLGKPMWSAVKTNPFFGTFPNSPCSAQKGQSVAEHILLWLMCAFVSLRLRCSTS